MLEVNSISKRFGDFHAVKGVSFNANQGEVLGFLGPNGAGKSTTMKMITGFLEATNGDAIICGNSIQKNTLEAKKNLGYVPENAPLYEDMYVREFLEFIAKMRGIETHLIENRVREVIKMCALESVEFQKIETLSKGYKRRVSLAQSLVHDPKVLILDEPTDGLDPNQKHDVRELIKKLAKEKCILISTHILEEVEEVCDRCIIIGEGEKLFEGTPNELKLKSDNGRIQDVFRAITTGHEIQGVAV
ncbi:ABC transporter, ATP-binding protein [Bacteriovorax sp. BSW11_IV]|uniref:ABC transporter ATP-binding protein n=1 Tax=Bacteriovorax sp. BSW11_IV TaxID=1353529 RepID=UPI000389ED13|nr:ATP-binding cassette domain-containing protein [Bacteriovorax sp. BSW11_IV]EQC48693.1 ABC transporter, ATP-binding protein [Bacteriovorax sp. BSW11_IV]